MSFTNGSVSLLLEQLSGGDMTVVDPLWRRYWRRLRSNAKCFAGKLTVIDEEDLAQCVFLDVIQRIADQRISNVENRHRLWRLMEVSTYHLAINMHRRDCADRRAKTMYEAPGDNIDSQLPEFLMSLDDEVQQLLKLLDPQSRAIVQMILHGFSSNEIASRLQMSQRTVQRKLIKIRGVWNDMQERQGD